MQVHILQSLHPLCFSPAEDGESSGRANTATIEKLYSNWSITSRISSWYTHGGSSYRLIDWLIHWLIDCSGNFVARLNDGSTDHGHWPIVIDSVTHCQFWVIRVCCIHLFFHFPNFERYRSVLGHRLKRDYRTQKVNKKLIRRWDSQTRAIDRRVVPTYVPVADWSRDSWTPCLVQQASMGMLRSNGINEIIFQW